MKFQGGRFSTRQMIYLLILIFNVSLLHAAALHVWQDLPEATSPLEIELNPLQKFDRVKLN